jgi:hypothetical protein
VSAGIARAVAAMLGVTSALLWSMCMYIVARSGFSSDPAADPHGYALMFGTVIGIMAGLLFAVALPAAFPDTRRKRVSRVCLLLFAGPTVALYLALALS